MRDERTSISDAIDASHGNCIHDESFNDLVSLALRNGRERGKLRRGESLKKCIEEISLEQ